MGENEVWARTRPTGPLIELFARFSSGARRADGTVWAGESVSGVGDQDGQGNQFRIFFVSKVAAVLSNVQLYLGYRSPGGTQTGTSSGREQGLGSGRLLPDP